MRNGVFTGKLDVIRQKKTVDILGNDIPNRTLFTAKLGCAYGIFLKNMYGIIHVVAHPGYPVGDLWSSGCLLTFEDYVEAKEIHAG